MQKISPGTLVANRALPTLKVKSIDIPDPNNTVHRRFAGCLFCSLHLHPFAQRHDEIIAAGIREVVVFRSTASALFRHHRELPVAIIPDPQGSFTLISVSSPGGAPC